MIKDELPEINRENFLGFVGQLQPLVRIFLTSRPHVDMLAQFSYAFCINIAANDSDIKAYLAYQISKNNRISMFARKDTMLKDEIIESLSGKAAGMLV